MARAMTSFNGCTLPVRWMRIALLLTTGAVVFGSAWPALTAGESGKRRPEVVAAYYPHWHRYDHGSAWKGEGWTLPCWGATFVSIPTSRSARVSMLHS